MGEKARKEVNVGSGVAAQAAPAEYPNLLSSAPLQTKQAKPTECARCVVQNACAIGLDKAETTSEQEPKQNGSTSTGGEAHEPTPSTGPSLKGIKSMGK